MVMHHYEPNCLQKDWCAVLKVKVTVKDHTIKICLFNIPSELLILLHLNLVWWHIIIIIVKRLDCCVVVKVKATGKVKISVNVHLDDTSTAAEPSDSKLCMVMHHHGPECHASRLVCCLQVQGHSEGSFNQIWLFLSCQLNCWSSCNQS